MRRFLTHCLMGALLLTSIATTAWAAPQRTLCLRNNVEAKNFVEVTGSVCIGFMLCFNVFTTKELAPGEQQCWSHRHTFIEMVTFSARSGSDFPKDAQKLPKHEVCRIPNAPLEGTVAFNWPALCGKV